MGGTSFNARELPGFVVNSLNAAMILFFNSDNKINSLLPEEVGASDGAFDGMFEIDGNCDGCKDGWLEGIEVGSSVGVLVGASVRFEVGDIVGELVGALVGKGLGALEGTSLKEGAIEGLSVALFVPIRSSAHC